MSRALKAAVIMKISKLFLLPLLFAIPKLVHAHCPLCSAAIGGAAVAASYYGIDPSIIGLFVGGFALSTGYWVANWVKKQYIPHQKKLIILSSLALTIIPVVPIVPDAFYLPLRLGEFIRVLWLNKILVGSILGIIISAVTFAASNKIKHIRGKSLFPYQGVILPLLMLVLTGALLYIIL